MKCNFIKKKLKNHIFKGRKIEVNLKGKPTKNQEAVNAGIPGVIKTNINVVM